MPETKPFFKTSEFWILIGALLGAITGIFPGLDGHWRSILAVAAAAAYAVSRGLAKSGVPLGTAVVSAVESLPTLALQKGDLTPTQAGVARAAEGIVKTVTGAVDTAHGVTHVGTSVAGGVAHTVVDITHPTELPGDVAAVATGAVGGVAQTVTGATGTVSGAAEAAVGGVESAIGKLLHRKPKS